MFSTVNDLFSWYGQPITGKTIMIFTTLVVGVMTVVAAAVLFWYRAAIHRRMKKLEESDLFGKDPFRMIRVTTATPSTDPNHPTTTNPPPPNLRSASKIRLVDLNPEFRAQHQQDWPMMSLGEYISTLRPALASGEADRLPEWMESEVQAALTAVLLKSLGPHFGSALLPALGLGMLQRWVQRLTQGLTSWIPRPATADGAPTSSSITTNSGSAPTNTSSFRATTTAPPFPPPATDHGGIPLSLFAMTYAMELNYQRVRDAEPAASYNSPVGLLRAGEVGYAVSFHAPPPPPNMPTVQPPTHPDSPHHEQMDRQHEPPMVPNPFILSVHWDMAIEAMEYRLEAMSLDQEVSAYGERSSSQRVRPPLQSMKSSSRKNVMMGTSMRNRSGRTKPIATSIPYDPDSKALDSPKPIDQRLLPDLHLGFGSAQCTHTKRDILKNRLLAILLNRLAHNYLLFLDGKPLDGTQVSEFVVLVQKRNGTQPLTKPTELMEALIEAGHTVETYVSTHSTTFGVGLCVKETSEAWTNIPLAYFMQNGYADAAGRDAFCCVPHSGLNMEIRGPLLSHGSIQHFMAIDGLCGWHSNHNVDVPWLYDVVCGNVWRGKDILESVRVAALQAVVINSVGDKLKLPYGGYGLTGVCNDTAAMIEYALTQKTHIYPLTMNGRFAMHNLRLARTLQDQLRRQGMNAEVPSLERLIQAMTQLPSDVNSLPVEAVDQCRRMLYCQHPESPFFLHVQSKEVAISVLEELGVKRQLEIK